MTLGLPNNPKIKFPPIKMTFFCFSLSSKANFAKCEKYRVGDTSSELIDTN